MPFHALKATVVSVVFISTGASIIFTPVIPIACLHCIFCRDRQGAIIQIFLTLPVVEERCMEHKVLIIFSFFLPQCSMYPNVSLLLSPGWWAGVLAGSQIGEFRLVATLCSHSTADLPNNAFFCVVSSPLSVPVFGIWDDFPCHSFAVACLLAMHFSFAAGRGDVPTLLLQRWRTSMAITLHTPSTNSCEILSGLT